MTISIHQSQEVHDLGRLKATTVLSCPFPNYPGSKEILSVKEVRTRVQGLSEIEIQQLGTENFPDPVEWAFIREYLEERDGRRRPGMQSDLTAYTPGETLQLLDHETVQRWHKDMASFKVPKDTEVIVFVPCAATKPWDTANRGIYKHYNEIRKSRDEGKYPGLYFVTISEPLGVVPESHWGSFPQYENPGLFSNSAQQSGMFTAEWKEYFGRKYHLPFDKDACEESIETLGAVIQSFLKKNATKSRTVYAFVGDRNGSKSTHERMLASGDPQGKYVSLENRFDKRHAARKAPSVLIRSVLDRHYNEH